MTKPLYQKIELEIRGKIKSGEYPLNSQIPTENELAQQLGVSRPTIRQALDSLTRHGYLTRVKGKGTFVTEPKVLHDSCRFLMSYQTESQYKGVSLKTKVIENVIVHPPGHVAQSLDLLPSEKAVKLTRLRWLEDYGPEKTLLGAHPVHETSGKKAAESVEKGEESGYCTIIGIGPMKFRRYIILPCEGQNLFVQIVDCSSEEKQNADPPSPVCHLFFHTDAIGFLLFL